MHAPRVVHIVPALFGPNGVVGGAERYVLELARYMANEVTTKLVTFGDQYREERDGLLDIRVIGNPWYVRGQRSNPFSPRLLSELREATVVHCHQQHVLASSIAALYSRLTHRRVFTTELGGGGWDFSSYVSTDRWYHGHLHISEYSREVFGHAHNARAHVILGGVDTEKFSPDERVARDGTAVFVGRILPHKGINYLIDAAPADMPVEVIGRRFDERYYHDLAETAQGKQITFRHDCGDDELVLAYRKAMCVVLPSVYKTVYGTETRVPELLGQTLLEGMACGTPAVCTDVASMPEIVENGVSGFVIPPNDPNAMGTKLRWLRDNPRRASAMGRAARERVMAKFTWDAVVRRCLEVYGI
ncbi:MAG: glycosyltransferase family 4 protein [Gemmatimonadales bacterium]